MTAGDEHVAETVENLADRLFAAAVGLSPDEAIRRRSDARQGFVPSSASGDLDPTTVVERILKGLEGEPLSSPDPEVIRAFSAARSWMLQEPARVPDLAASILSLANYVVEKRESPTTSAAIGDLMLAALKVLIDRDRMSREPTVLDIACGSGVLLAQAAGLVEQVSERPTQSLGCDIDSRAVSLATRLFNVIGRPARLECANTLAEDVFPSDTADVVIADLPLNLQGLPPDLDATDQRYRYGRPKSNNLTLALLQAMLAKLRAPEVGGGIVLALVSGGALGSRDERSSSIREAIAKDDLLRAVIALPERLMAATGIAVSVLVFDNAKRANWRDKVQFVDLRSQFIDSGSYRGRRNISEAGYSEMQRALHRPLPSRQVRTKSLQDMTFQEVTVRFQCKKHADRSPDRTFRQRLPITVEAPEWCERRYNNPHVSIAGTPQALVFWDPNDHFGSPGRPLANRATTPDWTSLPLLGSITEFTLIPSQRAKRRPDIPARHETGSDVVVIPLAANGDCRIFDAEDPPSQQCLILELRDRLTAQFLVDWLNADAGRLARRFASEMPTRHYSAIRNDSDSLRYLDRLDVPVPSIAEQQQVSTALDLLRAVSADIAQLEERVWSQPQHTTEVRQEVSDWVTRSERLDPWIDSLPYPLASSLRTYVSVRDHPREAYRQLLHVFEAFALFHATHLIAALRRDPSLWASERPRLIELLQEQHFTFERATFGTWRCAGEFLASRFRAQAFGDDPEQSSRYFGLLADPSTLGAERLLGSGFARVMGKALTLRNQWGGHGGAVNEREARERRDRLHEYLVELRGELGNGWGGLSLVRMGRSQYDGVQHTYSTEILQGVRIPFEPGVFVTHQPSLITGNLYLISDSGGALSLPGFVRMGPDPDPLGHTAYFYSSVDSDGSVRVVTYQHAQQSELHPVDPSLMQLIAELDDLQA